MPGKKVCQVLISILALWIYSVSVYSQETPVVIDVSETVTVSDTQLSQQSEWMELPESVTVTDTVDVNPVPIVNIDIAESVTVSDSPDTLPSLMVDVNESIGVSDSVGTLLSLRLAVSESVTVTDAVSAEAMNVFGPLADAGGPYAETEGQSITLDATGSTDADGNIALYEWDVNSDGTYEYSSSSPTQSHTFTGQGNYAIRLRVTDETGLRHEADANADIADSIPEANFIAEPLSGDAPLTVTFTNTSSGYDTPLTYVWDFNDDGTADSTSTAPAYMYSESGLYTVKLTARDSDESTSSLTVTNYISVTGCSLGSAMVSGNAGTSYHDQIRQAYESSSSGDTLKFRVVVFTETIDFSKDVTISLESGYNCDYSMLEGASVIQGSVGLSNGGLVIADGVLRVQ